MQIQVNASNGIENKDALERWVGAELQEKLGNFRDDITRVDVHLSDENSDKAGGGKRCTMEARLARHQPVAVNYRGATQDEVFRGALAKLVHSLESALGRLKNHRDRESIRKDGSIAED